MKRLLTTLVILLIAISATAQQQSIPAKGRWIGKMDIGKPQQIYFEFSIQKTKESFDITVYNGTEIVPLDAPIFKNNQWHVKFANFSTELVFELNGQRKIKGYWINHLKQDYQIPFTAEKQKKGLFPYDKSTTPADFDGKWKTTFNSGDGSFDAIGVFEQKKNRITGTFLTETGDYRFLSGNVSGDSMYLSGFDGSHIYLFVAQQDKQQNITGTFFSGHKYSSAWTSHRDDQFELRNFDSLTMLNGGPYDLTFKFHDLDGKEFVYPNADLEGKVVIIQILGTWCANCIDETAYFKTLYDKYKKSGLEIITIGYEIGQTHDDYAKALHAYIKRFNIQNKVLVGGNARKSSAKADFNFSEFSSFPTSIFIDRTGKVVRIHTGFSGPSTGKYYTDYTQKTEKLLEEMLKAQPSIDR